MNYAYSWGASVVILGTLFKLTHLPGANLMLFIGMGTEVFVFFISAFDRPFDKTADGMELATDTQLAAQLAAMNGEGVEGDGAGNPVTGGNVVVGGGVIGGGVIGSGVVGGGNIIVGGGAPVEGSETPEGATVEGGVNAGGPVVLGGGIVGGVAPTPAPAVTEETAEKMEEVTKTYIERLDQLNETLTKVAALSEKLSIDSEEMENLNRTLTGIARVYEMQLKSASQQITTQDDINEQAHIMAQKITELNAIYARMIEAMTVNMPGAKV